MGRPLKNNPQKSAHGGRRRGAGRPKGSPNRLTRTIKEAIEAAFNKAGGEDYLARMAVEQPVAFMSLLGKAMPQQIDASVTQIAPVFTVDDWVVPDAQLGHA